MQVRPDNWEKLFSSSHTVEWEFIVDGVTYTKDNGIWGVPVIEKPLMKEPVIGRCCTGLLTLVVEPQAGFPIPKAAPIIARCRLRNRSGDVTDWIEQGHFWVSQRKTAGRRVTLTCRDGMALTGRTYRDKTTYAEWPVAMADVVEEIATLVGIEIDPRTVINSDEVYKVDYPNEDTLMTDVLANIAAAHGGNWIMTENGKLRLVTYPDTGVPVFDLSTAYKVCDLLSVGDKTVSRITLNDSTGNQFTSGDDTGIELASDCEYATQTVANDVANAISGRSFRPYGLSGAYLDPCVELGDTITLKFRGTAMDVVASTIKVKCSPFYVCDVSAGVEDDDEEEFPYIDPSQRQSDRYVSTMKSYYGNRINRKEGIVSELMQNEEPVARLTANANHFTMQRKNLDTGAWEDCIYFDTQKRKYIVTGDVTVYGVITAKDLYTAGRTIINGANITTGTLNAELVQITGTDNFYWNADNIYLIDSENESHQIRIGRYDGANLGIGFTNDGGKTWKTAMDFNGLNTDFTEIRKWVNENYPTTEQVNSAIQQSSDQITLQVTQTVRENIKDEVINVINNMELDGNRVFVQLTEPEAPAKGDLWVKANPNTWGQMKLQTWGEIESRKWGDYGRTIDDPDIYVWTGSEWHDTFSDLKSRISRTNTKIDQTANEIRQTVSSLEQITEKNTVAITEANSSIKQTAEGIRQDVSRIEQVASDAQQSVNEAKSSINQLANKITLRVSEVEAQTQDFSAQLEVTAKEISSKVSANGIISAINQSAESVSISASKIKFEGLVTANNYFKILTDGSVEAQNGKFSGTLTAGNWTFDSSGSRFSSGNNYVRVYVSGSTAYYNTNGLEAEYGADYKHEARVRGSSVRFYCEDVRSSISVSKQDGKGGTYEDACLVPDESDGWDSGDAAGNLGTNLKPWDVAYFRSYYYVNMHSHSSRTVKHNIEALPDVGDIVDALVPVSYAYNFDKSDRRRFGLIYEDTLPILPEICFKGENENDGVSIDYVELVPILLREIKSLRRRLHAIDGN